jgi:hypothetical protein
VKSVHLFVYMSIAALAPVLFLLNSPASPVVAAEATPFCGMQYASGDDLPTVRTLGVTVVLQTFRHDGDPDEWLAQLDLARRHGLQVVGRLWPEGWTWDGAAWQIDEQARLFVQTVAAHPATLAVYALHEPYWRGCRTCGLTTAQQQELYRQIEAIADVPLYSEIGSITFWVDAGRATTLADGMCDYCAVSYYPFFADGSYDREQFIERLEEDLAAIRQLAPSAKLVWGLQVFAQSDAPTPRRMPTAKEIADIGAIVSEHDVDGIFWYVWKFGPLYDDFLSNHPELFPAIAQAPICARTLPAAVTPPPAPPTPSVGSTPRPSPTPPSPATPPPGPTSPAPSHPPKTICGSALLLGGWPLLGLLLLVSRARK